MDFYWWAWIRLVPFCQTPKTELLPGCLVEKDHPSYVFRVFAFFRQSVSKYSSWDARTADIKIILKLGHLTGRQVDLKLLRYPYGYHHETEKWRFKINRYFRNDPTFFLFKKWYKYIEIRVVGKGSWKKREVGKSVMKLEKVRKFGLKLESWSEVGKFWFNLERINEVRKLSLQLERSIELEQKLYCAL